jgi:predicted DCC family thiol-disulfide oxidoreductase YuxK
MASGPVLIYDGDCSFCSRCVRLAEQIGCTAAIRAWQDADLTALGITQLRAEREVLWIDQNSVVSGGARAIAMVLRDCGGVWRIPSLLMVVPPLSWCVAAAYRRLAANRHRLPGGTAACAIGSRATAR